MHRLLLFLCLAISIPLRAQPPRMELTPTGFGSVTVTIPDTPVEKLVEVSRNWAQEYNRKERDGVDITNVTDNSMTISAFRKNAFHYSNRGETFYQKIRYNMDLSFTGSSYTVSFTVTDIYADDNKRLTYLLPDYFLPDGRLKEDYEDIEPSLEQTVNTIVRAHYNFIVNFR